jgi:anti-sigma B factor antagonist
VSLAPQFSLDLHHRDDGIVVASAGGEIHVSTAVELSASLQPLVEAEGCRVVLDLTAVELIDSTGLSVLLGALREARTHHGALALACTNPNVLRLFEITHLDHTFSIHPTVEAACAEVQAIAEGSSSGSP